MDKPQSLFKFRVFWVDSKGKRHHRFKWAQSGVQARSLVRRQVWGDISIDNVGFTLEVELVKGVDPKQRGKPSVVPTEEFPKVSSKPRQLTLGDIRQPAYPL